MSQVVETLLCFNVTQLANHVEDLAAKSAQALSFLPLLPGEVCCESMQLAFKSVAAVSSACIAPGSRTRKISSSASFRSDWRHKAHSPTLLALDKPQKLNAKFTKFHNVSLLIKNQYESMVLSMLKINCSQYALLCEKSKWITSFEKLEQCLLQRKEAGSSLRHRK